MPSPSPLAFTPWFRAIPAVALSIASGAAMAQPSFSVAYAANGWLNARVSEAYGVSPNGTRTVGASAIVAANPEVASAFVWGNAAAGTQSFANLGDLPGDGFASCAYSVDSSGNVYGWSEGSAGSLSGRFPFVFHDFGTTQSFDFYDPPSSRLPGELFAADAAGSPIGFGFSHATSSTDQCTLWPGGPGTSLIQLSTTGRLLCGRHLQGTVVAGAGWRTNGFQRQTLIVRSIAPVAMDVWTPFTLFLPAAMAPRPAVGAQGVRLAGVQDFLTVGSNITRRAAVVDLDLSAFDFHSSSNFPSVSFLVPDAGILTNTAATGISDDGNTIVGYSRSASGFDDGDLTLSTEQAWVWRTAAPIMRDLRTVLTESGVDLGQWIPISARAVSADGRTVVGAARNQSTGVISAYRAVLPPVNDLCAHAAPLALNTSTPVNFGDAGIDGSSSCDSSGPGPDVWYSFTPACSGYFTFASDGSTNAPQTTVSIHSGCPGTLANQIACNTDFASAALHAGTPVLVRVARVYGAGTTSVIALASAPPNDCCNTAATLATNSPATFATCGATTQTFDGVAKRTVWYRWIAPGSAPAQITACPTNSHDVEVRVIAGSCSGCTGPAGSPAAALACSTPYTFNTTAGASYLIAVSEPSPYADGAIGTLSVSTGSCGPVNADSYRAAVLADFPLSFHRLDDAAGALACADDVGRPLQACGNRFGTYVGAPVRTASILGLPGSARDFASGQWVDDIPLATPSGPTVEAIEAWVRTSNPLAGPVLTGRSDQSLFSLALMIGISPAGNQPGKAIFSLEGPYVHYGAVSSTNVNDGAWHHLVGRRVLQSDTTPLYQIFVDGRLEATNNISVGTPSTHTLSTSGTWTIARYPAWAGGIGLVWQFLGSLDEVATYHSGAGVPQSTILSRAIPEESIARHYNVGSGTCTPVIGPAPTLVVARRGSTATLTFPVTSNPLVSYQWSKGAAALSNGPSATGSTYVTASQPSGAWAAATLSIQNLQIADAGPYSANVRSACGAPGATSTPINLQVLRGSDFNMSGTLDAQDIFDFLNAWFSGSPSADYDNSGTLTTQDIFAFLADWFAGV